MTTCPVCHKNLPWHVVARAGVFREIDCASCGTTLRLSRKVGVPLSLGVVLLTVLVIGPLFFRRPLLGAGALVLCLAVTVLIASKALEPVGESPPHTGAGARDR
jgi:hypothetical protein